jgi:outer membrane protein assembly factor BamB
MTVMLNAVAAINRLRSNHCKSLQLYLRASTRVVRCATASVVVLALTSASSAVAQGAVVVSPNTPYIITAVDAADQAYRFPDYRAGEVLTQRNDNNRTGASFAGGINQNAVQRFRKLGEFPVDGVVLAQPLYARNALVQNTRQQVLIVATSTNDVYAFSPFESSPHWLWRRTLGPPVIAEARIGASCDARPLAAWQQWETLHGLPNGLIGIEATPVIDLANNQVLVSFKTAEGHQHLAALDLNDGSVRKSVTVPAPNAAWNKLHRNRVSLLLADGVVFVGFSSLCEGNPAIMHGSITAFDARTLDVVGRYQVTDDATDGGGIWQGSTGLAADTRGNLYFTTGNRRCLASQVSTMDAPNRGNSVIRLKTERQPGTPYTLSMQPVDFFTPYRRVMEDCYDLDLSAAGVLLIPGSPFLATGGKEGVVYVLDRTDLGQYDYPGTSWSFASLDTEHRGQRHSAVPDDQSRDRVRQKFQATVNRFGGPNYLLSDWMRWPHIHGTPAFATFGGGESFMFLWGEKDKPKRFRWRDGKFDLPPLEAAPTAPPYVNDRLNGMPGGMLSVNVDPAGNGLGVVFASVKACNEAGFPACTDDTGPGTVAIGYGQNFGILRAFDPFTMREVWSNAGGERYWFAKLVPPTIANGRVFLATASGKVLIYGQ